MSRKNARRISHIFSIFPNYAYYESAILCGHFDTHIVDFKLFWKKNRRFLTKIRFENGVIITNCVGANIKFSEFWKNKDPKLNHEKDELKGIYLRGRKYNRIIIFETPILANLPIFVTDCEHLKICEKGYLRKGVLR